jgi:dephospho-CoA kinase
VLHVGLTGNIASGKSTVADLFARWGAAVIDADELVHELQRPGTAVFSAIVTRFGVRVVRPDGTLDRAALRRRVLAAPADLAALNRIVHPAVRERAAELVEEARREGARIVVSAVPLLFESDDPARFDAVVLVDAPAALRRERLLRDRALSLEDADGMLAAQMPSSGKRPRSTFIIENDGDIAALERRAHRVWDQLEAANAAQEPE